MRTAKAAGNLCGLLLLGVAGFAAAYGLAMVVATLFLGPTNGRVGGIVLATPTATVAGLFGVFVRKAVAGTVFPVDYDVGEAMRGFIGGGG